MNSNDNRFYLQALGASGLFVALIFVLWISLNGPANQAKALRNANAAKTPRGNVHAYGIGNARIS